MPQIRKGYTLVEIAIAVVILGILATLAIPAFQRIYNRSLATQLVNDIRIFSNAFTIYEMEQGTWPTDTSAGEMPSGMEGLLPGEYNEAGPGGGMWAWTVESESSGILNFQGSTLPPTVASMIDQCLDDGDLSGGRFVFAGGDFSFRLE